MPHLPLCPNPECRGILHLPGDLELTKIDTAGAEHIEGGYAGVLYIVACAHCHLALGVVPERRVGPIPF
jgi:hypothetical protein